MFSHEQRFPLDIEMAINITFSQHIHYDSTAHSGFYFTRGYGTNILSFM